MKKWIIGGSVLLILGSLALPLLNSPSDQTLIKEALSESIKASEEGRPGGVMKYLSTSLKFNETEAGDRLSISDYIRRAKPHVVFQNKSPVIRGDTATITSAVDVTLSMGPVDVPLHIKRAEVTFAKESTAYLGLVPRPVWRIKSIIAPEADTEQFQN